jgi:poly(A) polymerase
MGLIAPLLPEVTASGGIWTHTLRMLEMLSTDSSFPLALAAMLHDVGREAAGRICLRLKLSNAERDRVEWLVGMCKSLCDAPRMRNSALKPVLAHPGIQELLALHRADATAGGRGVEHVEFCEQKLRDWPPEVLDPLPILTGDDLLAFGIKQGPVFKRLLEAVRVAQLDGTLTTKVEAIELVRRIM